MPEHSNIKLSIEHVSKSFCAPGRDPVQALDDVSLNVRKGDIVCLVGPSGCGKSTLLNIMAGLDRPDSGLALIDGVPITGSGRDRMMMFQDNALFPWLNVLDNVVFSLKQKPNLSQKERGEVAKYYLSLVKMDRFAKSHVHELSGGMRQRVALARSLAPNPKVLLMDEPFSALDAMTREQLYSDLQLIQQRNRKTMVLVTHNVREAACLGNRIVLFSPHPGQVREQFRINLQRPRQINSPDLADIAAHVTDKLTGYVGREEGVV